MGCCGVIMAARARDVSGGGQKYDYPPHIAHVWAPTHRAHHLCSKLNFPVRRPCPKIFFLKRCLARSREARYSTVDVSTIILEDCGAQKRRWGPYGPSATRMLLRGWLWRMGHMAPTGASEHHNPLE